MIMLKARISMSRTVMGSIASIPECVLDLVRFNFSSLDKRAPKNAQRKMAMDFE
jgi:hypothetical protein